jgi:hypothetical protein
VTHEIAFGAKVLIDYLEDSHRTRLTRGLSETVRFDTASIRYIHPQVNDQIDFQSAALFLWATGIARLSVPGKYKRRTFFISAAVFAGTQPDR